MCLSAGRSLLGIRIRKYYWSRTGEQGSTGYARGSTLSRRQQKSAPFDKSDSRLDLESIELEKLII
jgi:hypothetical protein